MKVTAIMGMDVSKKTLDCYLFVEQKSLPPVSNNVQGFAAIKRWLLKKLKTTEGLLVVMEYTGIYTLWHRTFFTLATDWVCKKTCPGYKAFIRIGKRQE